MGKAKRKLSALEDELGFEISHEYWKIATDRVNGITADERKKIDEGQIKLF